MQEPDPIAIAFSDLHLTLSRPACRDDEDWMAVQKHYLGQVKDLAGDLPILFAGDLFDRWNPSPELIHFALKNLPNRMICVPGQHDLPNHRIDQMSRSGYGVLVEAGKIIDTSGGYVQPDGTEITIFGFGWDQPIKPCPIDPNPHRRSIALVHRYCWTEEACFPGAPEDSKVSAYKKELKGYNVAIFGDNHKSFLSQTGDCVVLNCGGFIRRKSDEIDYSPRVGVIFSDGSVKRKKLDTSIDRFHPVLKDQKEIPLNMKAFLEELEGLGEHGLNFREAVENHLKKEKIGEETKEIILQALEEPAKE